MGKYTKAIAAVVGTLLSAIVAALYGDNSIGVDEWVVIAIQGAGAASVLTAPNVPGARYTKSILAALTAVLVGLTSLITDGITVAEGLQLVIAALTALGVYQVKNDPPYDV